MEIQCSPRLPLHSSSSSTMAALLPLLLLLSSAQTAVASRRQPHHGLWPLPIIDDANDSTSIYLWPMPAYVSRGSRSIALDPDFDLVLTVASHPTSRNSFLVSNAFHRYKSLIFSHVLSDLDDFDPPESRTFVEEQLQLRRLVANISSDDDTLGLDTDESYSLYVPDDTSIIREAYLEANSIYGALRGLETFSQLCLFNFTSKIVEIKNAPWDIRDVPRFSYRGLLIDTSRHYQPIAAIKQVIDSMAYAKLNVLHWHIVDEQAFPLEIPSLPKLWKGSYTPTERYTISDAHEIVRYAKERGHKIINSRIEGTRKVPSLTCYIRALLAQHHMRGINVMAEIDVPGHAESWGYGYPDLWPSPNCREPLDVSQNFTFDVLNDILMDLRNFFPFGLFHLGGDEVDTSCWNNTPSVKQWLDEQEMTPHEAYVYFVLRAQKLALAHGWEPVNWEETFNQFADSLSPKTIVHNWLGSGVAPKVVAKGFRCIVSNQDVWYLDHLDVPWKSFYNNEPLESITNVSQQQLVLGGEVCMWGETVDASDLLQTIWPRAAAAAERLWSPLEYTANNINDAESRLEYFRCLLNERNVPAAPVKNDIARRPPIGPGSCFLQ